MELFTIHCQFSERENFPHFFSDFERTHIHQLLETFQDEKAHILLLQSHLYFEIKMHDVQIS